MALVGQNPLVSTSALTPAASPLTGGPLQTQAKAAPVVGTPNTGINTGLNNIGAPPPGQAAATNGNPGAQAPPPVGFTGQGTIAGVQGASNSTNAPTAQYGLGAQPYNPLDVSQTASLFAPVDTQGIAANINGGYGLQNTSNFQNAPQMQTSPLAGLTTLGQVSNSGAPAINTGTSQALTGGQIQNINALNATAQGQGPNLAAEQAQMTGQQNVANEMAMMGSQRGSGNSSLGLRTAGEANALANQQAVQAAVTGTTTQELNAQNQLQSALGTTQGQVQQGAQAQAGLQSTSDLANAAANNQAMLQSGSMGQQTALANAAQAEQTGLSNLSQQGATQSLNANEYNDMLQAQMTQANNTLTAQENYANLMSNTAVQQQGIAAKVGINSSNNQMGLAGAGIGGAAAVGAGALAASDRRLKRNIKKADRNIKDFLDKINIPAMEKPTYFNLMGAK